MEEQSLERKLSESARANVSPVLHQLRGLGLNQR
jgi:hypothetical protein